MAEPGVEEARPEEFAAPEAPAHDGSTSDPGGNVDAELTGFSMDLLDAVRPYLAESIMVLDRDWMVVANLAPPGGLIGRGLGLGVHTLEDMHPDDALQVMDLGLQAFETEMGWRGSILVRMHRGDGSYGRYEITAINHFDDERVGGMVVRTREVPEEIVNHWPGIESNLAVATIAELLPVGVLLLDGKGRVVFANETACGMLGKEPTELKRDGYDDLLHPADRPILADSLARLVTKPGREECTVRLEGARIERAEWRFCSEGEPDVTCVAVTIEDITQRWATERALERRANHDGLTGLRNRESLFDELQDRVDRGEPTTVAFVDLDGFKSVNDRWGHERGDRLLVDVARVLAAGLAAGEEVGRFGGDEFVVVAGEVDPDELSARVREIVASVDVDGGPVSCSVGVSVAGPGDTLRDLMHRADTEMYRAKRGT